MPTGDITIQGQPGDMMMSLRRGKMERKGVLHVGVNMTAKWIHLRANARLSEIFEYPIA